MNTFGKVLVGVNFLFSLLVGALILMVFTTRTQWQKGYEKVSAELVGERAAHATDNEKHNKQFAQQDKTIKTYADKDAVRDKDMKDLQDKTAEAVKDKKTAEADRDAMKDQLAQISAERNNLLAEVKQLGKLNAEQLVSLNDLEKRFKEAKEQEVKQKITADSALARLTQLVDQIEKMQKEIGDLRNDRAVRSGTLVDNPPPEDVKGTIQSTDPQHGLVTINLGSDSGLSKGNTLHIYRLSPRPTYVGQVRVVDVRAHEAVAKLTSASRPTAVQVGDEVASKILDNR